MADNRNSGPGVSSVERTQPSGSGLGSFFKMPPPGKKWRGARKRGRIGIASDSGSGCAGDRHAPGAGLTFLGFNRPLVETAFFLFFATGLGGATYVPFAIFDLRIALLARLFSFLGFVVFMVCVQPFAVTSNDFSGGYPRCKRIFLIARTESFGTLGSFNWYLSEKCLAPTQAIDNARSKHCVCWTNPRC
jgi:hypothetical protein